jgi:hypothetical protein
LLLNLNLRWWARAAIDVERNELVIRGRKVDTNDSENIKSS